MSEREEEHLVLVSDVIDGGGDQVHIADYLWKRGYRIARSGIYILESFDWDPACGCAHSDLIGVFPSLEAAKIMASRIERGPCGPDGFGISEYGPDGGEEPLATHSAEFRMNPQTREYRLGECRAAGRRVTRSDRDRR